MTEALSERDLLVMRLEIAKEQGTLFTIHTIDGETYTPDDIVNEAKAGTPIGNEFLAAEKKLMDYLNSKL
jgi:hypothetical protein